VDQPTTNPVDGMTVAEMVERVRQLRAHYRDRGHFSPAESAEYGDLVYRLRGDDERLQKWIARRIGVSRGRIAQIISRHRARLAATTQEVAA